MKTSQQLILWHEGEKIPDEELTRIFQRPPSVPPYFGRSALVVGSKGAGKTTLLRYQKEIHEGVAIHLSLATELASLSKQAAVGPLTLHTKSTQDELLIGKTISLLALSISERLSRKGLEPPWNALRDCLPSDFTRRRPKNIPNWIRKAKLRISRASLKDFSTLPDTRPLVTFLAEMGNVTYEEKGPLLLLLDRADLVVPTALVPVLELLDQSPGFVVLLATRPGHGGATLARLEATGGPGDQYDVIHLGLRPRSDEWLDFMYRAVAAQLQGANIGSVASSTRDGVLFLARDSLRTALEAFSRGLLAGDGNEVHLRKALVDLRELQLNAVQSKVRPHHPEFRRLVTETRKREMERSNGIRGPVTVSVATDLQPTLFNFPTELALFMEAGLRSAGFCMPEGRIWLPGLIPDEVEIPPLLLWDPEDAFWDRQAPSQVEPLRYSRSAFLKTRGGPPPSPTIFIAFRMDSPRSIAFRRNLEQEVSEHPALRRCEITDGRVVIGEDWAPMIRERISRAKLVVGDATGLRPEVVFELGFAYGLNTPVLPVVESLELSEIPFWLRSKQIGTYDSTEQLREIVASIETHLVDPKFFTTTRQTPPVPNLAIWLGNTDWEEKAADQFTTSLNRAGLKVERYSESSPAEEVLRRATIATVLGVTMAGTSHDAFAHFVCGAVAARPNSGYGQKKLPRRILVLEDSTGDGPSFTAEGLSRCIDTVTICHPTEVASGLASFLDAFRSWNRTVTGSVDR